MYINPYQIITSALKVDKLDCSKIYFEAFPRFKKHSTKKQFKLSKTHALVNLGTPAPICVQLAGFGS